MSLQSQWAFIKLADAIGQYVCGNANPVLDILGISASGEELYKAETEKAAFRLCLMLQKVYALDLYPYFCEQSWAQFATLTGINFGMGYSKSVLGELRRLLLRIKAFLEQERVINPTSVENAAKTIFVTRVVRGCFFKPVIFFLDDEAPADALSMKDQRTFMKKVLRDQFWQRSRTARKQYYYFEEVDGCIMRWTSFQRLIDAWARDGLDMSPYDFSMGLV